MRYGYFPKRPGIDGKVSRDSDAMVYCIGPRGGVKGYEGCCRIDELTKFYGEDVHRIPAGYFEKGRWVRVEELKVGSTMRVEIFMYDNDYTIWLNYMGSSMPYGRNWKKISTAEKHAGIIEKFYTEEKDIPVEIVYIDRRKDNEG